MNILTTLPLAFENSKMLYPHALRIPKLLIPRPFRIPDYF